MSSHSARVKTVYAKNLLAFSSQYGRENSVSYVAGNVLNEPRIFPEYGDFTNASVFRTYGKWWKEAPETSEKLAGYSHSRLIEPDDFLEVEFEEKLYINSVTIYEVYNPGAVVRILARHPTPRSSKEKWFVLWSKSNLQSTDVLPKQSRQFTPPLKRPYFPTSVIRIEFIHDYLDYYTELDAIEMTGSDDVDVDNLPNDPFPDFDSNMTALNLQEPPDNIVCRSSMSISRDNGYFDKLPSEILLIILSYLAMDDLGKVSQVSHLFYEHCYNPLLPCNQYMNLKPIWYLLDSQTIEGFVKKCSFALHLSLSWCPMDQNVLELVRPTLVRLDLSCCHLDDNLFKQIIKICTELEDLDISSTVVSLSATAICCISTLSKLKRTATNTEAIVAIAFVCPELEYINLGSCVYIPDYDNALAQVVTHCKRLKSLDLWRAKSLSDVGLVTIADSCPELISLDIGWCRFDNEIQGSTLAYLSKKCPKLRKLVLTAVRCVSNVEVQAFALNCPELEQMDLLGSSAFNYESLITLLDSCKKLKFLDVSFCQSINPQGYKELCKRYPHCTIKKSFTPP